MAVSRAINTFLDQTTFAFSSVSLEKSYPFCAAPLVLLKELTFRKFYWEFREGFSILGALLAPIPFFVNRFVLTSRVDVVEFRLFETIRCVCRKRQREQEIAEEEAAKKKKEWEKQWDVRIINCIFLIS